jgi:UDPglucose 6-dehydrogenase
LGVDINPLYVKAIQEGRPPVNEPHLAEMIQTNRERLTATESYDAAILAIDLTFIIVPTPSGSDGRFSMEFVLQAAEKIGAALRRKRRGTWWCSQAP